MQRWLQIPNMKILQRWLQISNMKILGMVTACPCYAVYAVYARPVHAVFCWRQHGASRRRGAGLGGVGTHGPNAWPLQQPRLPAREHRRRRRVGACIPAHSLRSPGRREAACSAAPAHPRRAHTLKATDTHRGASRPLGSSGCGAAGAPHQSGRQVGSRSWISIHDVRRAACGRGAG